MTTTNIIYPPNSVVLNDFKRTEPLLSVQDLKRRYLHAVDFRDNNGNELPDDVFSFYIDSAITHVEQDCGIYINPVQINEDRDYVLNDYLQWCILELYENPVIRIDKFEIRFLKNDTFVQFPDDWIRLDNMTGMIRIAATMGQIDNWVMTQFSYLPRLMTRVADFPHFFHIEYTAGFEQDKIPKNVNHLIGLIAAIDALNIAGDIILGAGIASQSLSLDGLSQSISSTSSATNAGYGARILQYLKQVKDLKVAIKRFFAKDQEVCVV